jgi:hypothetical protein
MRGAVARRLTGSRRMGGRDNTRIASDILLSTCIVLVEGPSDRLYLNYWIKGIAPDLEEGTHYSIMFYGGRLS